MTQLRFFRLATFTLLLVNLGMVAFFFLTKPPPRGVPGKAPGLEILELDLAQEKRVMMLIEIHQQEMRSINQEQRSLIHEYFQLQEDSSSGRAGEIMDRISINETKKIRATNEHFEQIRVILKPDQRKNFDEFREYVLQLILAPSKKNLGPPKDF